MPLLLKNCSQDHSYLHYIIWKQSKPIEKGFVCILLLLLCEELWKLGISNYKIWNNGRILMFKISKWLYRSFASGATASIVAKNWTNNLSQPFKELQGSNSEFKLITSKSITQKILGIFWDNLRNNLEPFWDHFGTIWHNFGTILGPF